MPPNVMDPECVPLCEAMNKLPGIKTFESCCGHGEHPFRIWFTTKSLDVLPRCIYWFSPCHSGAYGWSVTASTDCGMSPVVFMVEGPIGHYKGANKIAKYIEADLKEESPS